MPLTREQLAQRAALELKDGYIVNLGIGIPTLVANYVPKGIDVWLQSENGLLVHQSTLNNTSSSVLAMPARTP